MSTKSEMVAIGKSGINGTYNRTLGTLPPFRGYLLYR